MIDLKLLINENDSNWKIRENKILYHRLCDIIILSYIDDTIWVSLDRRVSKQVVQIVKKLVENDIDFYFNSPSNTFCVINEDTLSGIIRDYIFSIEDVALFDGFRKIGFDISRSLSNLMTDYECHYLFKPEYENAKIKLLTERMDWRYNRKYFDVKREDIRNYIRSLEREIRINLWI